MGKKKESVIKMSQKSDLLKYFRANGNRLTLGQILNTKLAAEYRARITDLRGDGYVIICDDKNKPNPSENVYTLIEEKTAKETAQIAEWREIQATYPIGHRQREKIEEQITQKGFK